MSYGTMLGIGAGMAIGAIFMLFVWWILKRVTREKPREVYGGIQQGIIRQQQPQPQPIPAVMEEPESAQEVQEIPDTAIMAEIKIVKLPDYMYFVSKDGSITKTKRKKKADISPQ